MRCLAFLPQKGNKRDDGNSFNSRFEIGSGFEGTKLHGSQHNDPYYLKENGKLGTLTNNSGGIQGYNVSLLFLMLKWYFKR